MGYHADIFTIHRPTLPHINFGFFREPVAVTKPVGLSLCAAEKFFSSGCFHDGMTRFPDAMRKRGATFPHAAMAIPAVKCFAGSLIAFRHPPWHVLAETKHRVFPSSPETALSSQFHMRRGSSRIPGFSFATSINVMRRETCCRHVFSNPKCEITIARTKSPYCVWGGQFFSYVLRPSPAIWACRVIFRLLSTAKPWREAKMALSTIIRSSGWLRTGWRSGWLFLVFSSLCSCS